MLSKQKIINMYVTDNVVIKSGTNLINVRVANNFFTRFRGLLWGKPLALTEGLLLTSCNSVHTIGMRYAIDIIFLNHQFKVTSVVSNCKPIRFTYDKHAKHTFEMLAGQAAALGLKVGAQLSIEPTK